MDVASHLNLYDLVTAMVKHPVISKDFRDGAGTRTDALPSPTRSHRLGLRGALGHERRPLLNGQGYGSTARRSTDVATIHVAVI